MYKYLIICIYTQKYSYLCEINSWTDFYHKSSCDFLFLNYFLRISILFLILIMYICVWLCVCSHCCRYPQRPEEGFGFPGVVSYPLWVPRTELQFSARIVLHISSLTMSPALCLTDIIIIYIFPHINLSFCNTNTYLLVIWRSHVTCFYEHYSFINCCIKFIAIIIESVNSILDKIIWKVS